MQRAIRLLFPPQCLTCNSKVESERALCGLCWSKTPFIFGLVCDKCGTPMPGQEPSERKILCDECIKANRPWARGRAAIQYSDNGRKLVLSLKHGDRQELARPAANWMLNSARPLLRPNMLVAPVPLHWSRLVRRRYNQAAQLAKWVAQGAETEYCPDLLIRHKRTRAMDNIGHEARYAHMKNTIIANNSRNAELSGANILLVDDVMTSGATLTACAEACHLAGAAQVYVVVLARVAKDA